MILWVVTLSSSRSVRDINHPLCGNGIKLVAQNRVSAWLTFKLTIIIHLILHRGRVGQIYNVGANQEMRNIDVVKMICKELGKSESLISFVKDCKGHNLRYAVDATKIQQELGWTVTVGFEEGLRQTVRWYEKLSNGKARD